MAAPTVNTDAEILYNILAPELKKLCANAGPFCTLSLEATLHDGDVGQIRAGIITSRKVAPRSNRAGGAL